MSLGKKLIFSAVTVALFFIIAEGIARVFIPPLDTRRFQEHEQIIRTLGLPALGRTMVSDPLLFWSLKPGMKGDVVEGRILGSEIRFTVSTNRHGLRGPEIPSPKAGVRVLALGDSTAFGLGVDDDQTWPAVLQGLLRERLGRPVEVINAGVPGYTAYQGMRYLEERGLSLDPDLVIATFGFNDADSWSSRSDYQMAWLLTFRRWERPLLYSRLYSGAKLLVGRNEPPIYWRMKRPRLSPEEFSETLSRIQRICASQHVPLVLVIWPYAGQKVSGNQRFINYQPLIQSFAARRNLPVVDLVERFARIAEPLFLDHVHANAAGNRAAAEAILPICEDQIEKVTGKAEGLPP